MFISKKKLQAIEDRIEKRTHTGDFEFWRREVMELKSKIVALEEALGLTYATFPQKSVYRKKGGPERGEP